MSVAFRLRETLVADARLCCCNALVYALLLFAHPGSFFCSTGRQNLALAYTCCKGFQMQRFDIDFDAFLEHLVLVKVRC